MQLHGPSFTSVEVGSILLRKYQISMKLLQRLRATRALGRSAQHLFAAKCRLQFLCYCSEV
uniref:Uncharacterized protein n=1 Tax=Arundo donax TaxID=35708 RepID=A0A0A9FI50_ARUDO